MPPLSQLPYQYVNIIYYLVETVIDYSERLPPNRTHFSRTIICQICQAYSEAEHFYIFEAKFKLLKEYIEINCQVGEYRNCYAIISRFISHIDQHKIMYSNKVYTYSLVPAIQLFCERVPPPLLLQFYE